MFDVIIVGGGPVGVFVACELKLAGAKPLVIERLSSISQDDKAHGLTGQVVRLLDHRGLFERASGTSIPEATPGFFFGAMPLPLHMLTDDNPMHLLPINQRDFEQMLNVRAEELGVEIRRGVEMKSFTQFDDHVEVTLSDLGAGTESILITDYLIGSDGARSNVRKQSGIGFPGHTDRHIVDRTALIAPSDQFVPVDGGNVDVAGLGRIPGTFYRTENGVFTIAMLDPQNPVAHTMEWEEEPDGNCPGPGSRMSMAEMESSIERVIGAPVKLTPPPEGRPTLLRRLSGRNTRLAERYRDRRVFLVGDSAHVHSAAGGPGLNLALQDAANLAWKIAADIDGWAPKDLLSTYESERRPLGERVFMQTQAQTALMSPGSDVTALRELFSELLNNKDNLQHIADLIAGSDVRYNMGEGELAGWFAPTIELTLCDGHKVRLAELLRSARPILVDTTGGTLASSAAPWSQRVDYIQTVQTTAMPSMLIRPDGYVAWSGIDQSVLYDHLKRWFGPPSGR